MYVDEPEYSILPFPMMYYTVLYELDQGKS